MGIDTEIEQRFTALEARAERLTNDFAQLALVVIGCFRILVLVREAERRPEARRRAA